MDGGSGELGFLMEGIAPVLQLQGSVTRISGCFIFFRSGDRIIPEQLFS